MTTTTQSRTFHRRAAVHEWMSQPAITIEGTEKLAKAYMTMQDNGVRRLPVVKRNGELIGIITMSDLMNHVPFFPEDPELDLDLPLMTMTVQEVMSWEPETVSPEDTVQDAAELMMDAKISGLPVVNNKGQVVGMLTESDIFRLVIESWED
jgi:acetoin utilization protein AcuB